MFLHIHDTKQTTLSTTLLDHTFKQCQGDRLVGYWVSQGRVTFLSRRGRRLLVESSSKRFGRASYLSVSFVYKTTQIFLFSTSKPQLKTRKTKTHLDAFCRDDLSSLSSGKFGKTGKTGNTKKTPYIPSWFYSHHGLLTCSWCSEVPFKQSQQIAVNVGSWGIPSKKRWRK